MDDNNLKLLNEDQLKIKIITIKEFNELSANAKQIYEEYIKYIGYYRKYKIDNTINRLYSNIVQPNNGPILYSKLVNRPNFIKIVEYINSKDKDQSTYIRSNDTDESINSGPNDTDNSKNIKSKDRDIITKINNYFKDEKNNDANYVNLFNIQFLKEFIDNININDQINDIRMVKLDDIYDILVKQLKIDIFEVYKATLLRNNDYETMASSIIKRFISNLKRKNEKTREDIINDNNVLQFFITYGMYIYIRLYCYDGYLLKLR